MKVLPQIETVQRRDVEVRCAGPVFPDIERLAVIRHDRMGDLILTLPAVAALRETYPRARLALAVQPSLAPLANMFEGVDEVLGVDPAGLRSRLAAFGPQLVVCISRGAGAAWSALRSGAKHRVGTGRRFFSWMFDRTVEERRRLGGRHEVEYALSFAHRSGAAPAAARFPIRCSGSATEEISDWLESAGITTPFAVLHPGSGGSCPTWPRAHFVALAELLRRQGRQVVFSIGPQDEPIDEAPVFSGGLSALAALLSRAALVIGNSTGPIHLSAAFETPTLAFHAPWSSCGVSRWGPYSRRGYGMVVGSAGQPRSSAVLSGISPEHALEAAVRILEQNEI